MTRCLGVALWLIALGGCGEVQPDPLPPPSPLVYEIASADGAVEGWLLGTIHALPDGAKWRTAAIDTAIAQADALVVEVAGLDDPAKASALFSARAARAQPLDLLNRVPAADRSGLAGLADAGGVDLDELQGVDTWAAALTLASGVRYGDSANGVDRAVLGAFRDRPVIELEGMAYQFDLFDDLPETEQRDLLRAVVHDYQRWRDDPGHLTRAWLTGDLDQAIDPRQSALLADPELRLVLLDQRNRAWLPRIDGLLKQEPQLLIAVGGGHVSGETGLTALLQSRGYRLRPLR